MTDAEILRSQIPASTDPEHLEREAVRAEASELITAAVIQAGAAALLRCHWDFSPGMAETLAEEVLRATAPAIAKPPLGQALRHISRLTSFYMDNVLWTQACEKARAFVERMGSAAGAAPLTPDRPSPPATDVEGALV